MVGSGVLLLEIDPNISNSTTRDMQAINFCMTQEVHESYKLCRFVATTRVTANTAASTICQRAKVHALLGIFAPAAV